MRRHPRNRLPPWQRRFIYLATGALIATGAGWMIVSYLLAPAGEAVPAPHAFAPALLAIHGIAAYLSLTALGFVCGSHLRNGWRLAAQRVPGILLWTAWVLLVATGIAFYYFVDDASRPMLRNLHIGAGLLMPIVLVWHIVQGRRLAGRQ
jgi:hypothetical protein